MKSFAQRVAYFGKCYPWVAFVMLLGSMMLFMFFKDARPLFAVISLAVLNGSIIYYKSTKQIPFDFVPTFLFSLSITYVLGFGWGLAFVLLGLVLPSFFSGAVEPISFMWWSELVGLNLLSLVFGALPIVLMGVIMAGTEFVVSFIINLFFIRNLTEFVPFSIFAALVNVVYFVAFGSFLSGLLRLFS